MLVLSRRNGESLVFKLPDGREIEVRVAQGGPCRLAVNAPSDVAVVRPALGDAEATPHIRAERSR